MSVDLKAATPDATMAAGAVVFGADSQAAASPSVFTIAAVSAYLKTLLFPTTTVAGRLARYTDTSGTVDSTAGLFEDGSGNVGIATTSPAKALDVHGTVNVQRDGADYFMGFRGSDSIAVAYIDHTQGGTTNQLSFVGGSTNSSFRFTPTGTGTFVIATGDVGIGTSPSTKLHANGPIRCASYTVATLPSAAAVGAGSRAYITDALGPTFGAAAVGGGAVAISVIANGTTWNVGG